METGKLKLLISKIQYKNYETGEFDRIELRTAEETIELIKNFPWNEQRHLADVVLTCPSITIEHYPGSYLKIGHYFNGKFCFYYLATDGRLFEKPISFLTESYHTINDYYLDKNIEHEFHKSSWVFDPKRHFITDTFEYEAKGPRVFWNVVYQCFFLIMILFYLFLAYLLTAKFVNSDTIGALIMAIPTAIITYFYVRYALDYYSVNKNSFLKLSKGHNTFYFGTKESYKEYNKEDIISINNYSNEYTRMPVIFKLFELNFKNGEQIFFTGMLLNGSALRRKFPEHHVHTIQITFPSLKL